MANKYIQKIEFQAKIKDLENKIKKSKKGLGGLNKSALAVGASLGTMGALAIKSINSFARLEAVEKGFKALAKETGFSTTAFIKLQQATDGTVDKMTLMRQANNALLLGVVKSEDEMANLMDVAQRLGNALGQDTASAVESLVTGMGRQSKLMLDNLGIMIDMEKAYEDFAISQGTTVKNLTDEQKKRAFNIATMKEAEAMVQQLGAEELSTTDNLNQLSAAYEDLSASVGRALAPAVNAFASFARAATEVTVADELEKEQRIFNNLVGVMRDTNSSTDQRARALKALKSDYKVYLGNLETEEEILKNLDKIQDDYNTKMRRRIREELLSTGLEDAERDLESARQKLFEIEAGFGSARFNIIKDAIEGTTSVGDAFKQVMASLGGFSNVVDFGSLAMELEEFIRLQMMLPTLEKQLAEQKAFNDEYRKRNPIVKEGTDAIKENTKAIEENNDTTNADLLTIDEFVEQKAKQLKEYEHEQDLIAQLIEQRPDLAKALNLETEAIKKQTEAEAMNVKMKQKAFEAAGQLADAGANLASSFLGETKEVLRIRQIAAAVDAAAAVNAILADAVSIPNSLIRTALAISTAVNAAANIKSIQNQISKLQTGGSYITGGEQILQVGEAGAEEVNVTPLDDPTADSSAAGGSTVVINNPMLTESVIEDEIIPMIQRAIDRGAELN